VKTDGGARAQATAEGVSAPPSGITRTPAARPRPPLAEIARGAVWFVGLAAVLQIVARAFGASPLAAALAGAVIADLGSARAGVRWDEPRSAALPGGRHRIARWIALGAALGAIAVALTLLTALALGWATVAAGSLSAGFALAFVRATALAIRDELLLTGIAFAAAARAGVPSRYALAFAALAHGAAVALAPGSSAAAVALAVATGVLAASLRRRRGAWAAIAAPAMFNLLVGVGLRGGLLDVTWKGGALVAGARASGHAAWLAAAALVAVTLLEGPIARAMARRSGARAIDPTSL
jgi:hypothetical protein